MPSFVIRIWLADRPGALGAVASRIGAVGGDLIAIDVLERGEGRAIDELTIDLPSEDLIPTMLAGRKYPCSVARKCSGDHRRSAP